MISCVVVQLLFLQFIGYYTVTDAKVLDDYIKHYEELRYSADNLHQRHMRAKRSTDRNLSLKFRALGRDFDIHLTKTKIFSDDHEHRFSNGTKDYIDTSFIYDGKLRDVPNSYVHGAIIEGVFQGFIEVPGDTTYHVEHSRRFFGNNHSFHSLIYSDKHLNLDPYKDRRNGRGTCGLDHHHEWMTDQSHSHHQAHTDREKYINLYTEEQQDAHQEGSHQGDSHRSKRETDNKSCMGTLNTCYMYLRSDPVLHKYLMSNGATDQVAKDQILALFTAHVAAINKIYKYTKFETYQGQESCEGVQFQVQRTSIMTDETEFCNNPLKAKEFCNPNIDVSNFLNLNSLVNHDEFCLAYVFTARDFLHGTLGLAWVGSSSSASGGICERYKLFTESNNKIYKSLNTGVVTIRNYAKQVAPRVSHLTFAHECGHNFGSPHDSGEMCAPYNTNYPGASQGNYIMYASATQGDLPHNSEFSACSKDNITRVLQTIVFGRISTKKNCFKKSGAQFCGNGIVEGDEECDCGFEDYCKDVKDKCCNGKKSGVDSPDDCKLKTINGKKYDCSPSQGPCCTDVCEFRPESANYTCRTGTECVKKAICRGNNANCPAADNYPDILTLCNDKNQVCESGVCSGSLCKYVGYTAENKVSDYEECFKTQQGDSEEGLCFLSCRKKNTTTCFSSAESDLSDANFKSMLENIRGPQNDIKISLPAGSPCNNYKGYCDVFQKCKSIDNDGPLSRLKDIIFSEETLTNIVNFLSEYWWGVMLCCIGLVILMAIFIKVCAVHTPSSNPKAKPALKLSDTLRRRRRPQQTYQQQQQPLHQYSNQNYPCADETAEENSRGTVNANFDRGTTMDYTSMVSGNAANVNRFSPTNQKIKNYPSTAVRQINTSQTVEKTTPHHMSLIRAGLALQGISTSAQDIICSSWRAGTKKQYHTYFNKWEIFCSRRQSDTLFTNVTTVLDFLTELFHSNVGYSAINTARSALSSLVKLSDSHHAVGTHPLIIRFMKGVFESRPSLPRYKHIWNVKDVLDYLKKWNPTETLPLKQLTFKLATLLAILTGQRCQTLHVLKISDIICDDKQITIPVSAVIKQSSLYKKQPVLVLPVYHNKNICVVHTLKCYLSKTSAIRNKHDQLFLQTIRPFTPAGKSTIARWIKTVLQNAGVNIDIYGAHSTRAAASSQAAKMLPISTILKCAGWSSCQTFQKFYYLTEDNSVQSGDFATVLLDSL